MKQLPSHRREETLWVLTLYSDPIFLTIKTWNKSWKHRLSCGSSFIIVFMDLFICHAIMRLFLARANDMSVSQKDCRALLCTSIFWHQGQVGWLTSPIHVWGVRHIWWIVCYSFDYSILRQIVLIGAYFIAGWTLGTFSIKASIELAWIVDWNLSKLTTKFDA